MTVAVFDTSEAHYQGISKITQVFFEHDLQDWEFQVALTRKGCGNDHANHVLVGVVVSKLLDTFSNNFMSTTSKLVCFPTFVTCCEVTKLYWEDSIDVFFCAHGIGL